jgi:hypothetical protein
MNWRPLVLAGVATVTLAWPAAAQDGYTNAHHLGGSTSFHQPPLTTVATLKKMAGVNNMAADIRKLLRDAGIPETSDAVIDMLDGGVPSVQGTSCATESPDDKVLVDCDFQPGDTLEWMAYRPNLKKHDRTPGRILKFRWAGRRPFKAFLFRVTNNGRIFKFVVPKDCGNLSLMSVIEPRSSAVAAPAPPPPAPPPPAPAPPPPARVEAPPPAPPVAIAPPPPPAAVKSTPFFIDMLGGKDRRVRPIAGRTTVDGSTVIANSGSADFAQCSPLVGLKIGVGRKFQNDWEVNGAVGVAVSLVSDDKKVRESELFADVELNKYVGGGAFVGTGLSLWDLTRSDSFSPAWMLHFGVPLGDHPSHPLYFVGEGRLFLNHTDDIPNNYQFWAGVRVHF